MVNALRLSLIAIHLTILLPFIGLAQTAFGADVDVTANIDGNSAYAMQQVKGTLSVTHSAIDPVNTESVLIGNEPLQVALVKEVKVSQDSPLMISIYSFLLSPKKAGLYALPPIKVTVGGKEYRSISTSYKVSEGEPSRSTRPSQGNYGAQVNNTPLKASLKLEALVDGKTSLYPGERTKLVYRYNFIGNIALTSEKLPLLDAIGMLKIGEKEIKDFSEGNTSIREISQVVEAINPGNFDYGPSEIEGLAYEKNQYGKLLAGSTKLTSKVEPLTVHVLPFPELNRPQSFNGAVGNFQFNVKPPLLKEVHVQDEITIEMTISGIGNIDSVKPPDLSLQPGFQGFFKVSDLPPEIVIKGNTKIISLKIRPITSDIKEIPSIEFSYFDPNKAVYMTLRSKPFSIEIKKVEQEIKSPVKPQPSLEMDHNTLPEITKMVPSKIEIEGNFILTSESLRPSIFGSWWVLAILPFGVTCVLYQMQMRQYFLKKQREKRLENGFDLLNKALETEPNSSLFFSRMSDALKRALYDSKMISSPSLLDDEIPSSGVSGEVKNFLQKMTKMRFGTGVTIDHTLLVKEAFGLVDNLYKQSSERQEA